MSRLPIYTLLSIATLACGSKDGTGNGTATNRDSAGVAITEYPSSAWADVPEWQLSAQPLAVIGGDPDDATIDLSTSTLVGILSDNRIVVSTFKPAQLYLFSVDGSTHQKIGHEGEGPGEYRVLSQMQILPGDTIVVHEAATRKALFFLPDGTPAGSIQFPFGGTPVPPTPIGRLGSDLWLFQLINPLTDPPPGAGATFRLDAPIVSWYAGEESMDTLLDLPGAESYKGSVDVGTTNINIARPLGYTTNSFAAITDSLLWTTSGDRFVIDLHDSTGAPLRSIRVDRPTRQVASGDREIYKEKLREGYERVKSMGLAPPALIQSELDKIDQTQFADHFPAVGQMVTDRSGRVWVTEMTPGVDSSLTYVVFDRAGKLLGKVALPDGLLVAATSDRVVVRREDDATGLVRLEVWGVMRGEA